MKAWGVSLWVLICSWSVYGQPLTRDQLTGVWIGVHTKLGSNVYCPLPTYLDLQANGTYRLGLVDESTPAREATWNLTADTLRLDNMSYAPGLVTLQADTLRIGTVYPMTFRRFHNVPIDSAITRQLLTNRVWQTDSLLIHFHDNGRICLESCTTGERTVHHWRLTRYANSVFILIQGSQHTTDGHYKPLWQVVSAKAGLLQLTGWDGQRITTETGRLVRTLPPGDSCKATGFQVCDNCFSQASYFRATGLSLSKQYAVRTLVRNYYQPLNQAGQSGLIQVRFVINCAGEMGLFSMTELDNDYCGHVFDQRITNQLSALCHHQLLGALIGDSAKLSDQSDKAITLNFRLKDGQLTDVFP